jgi:plasmid stabilization system protein ParE
VNRALRIADPAASELREAVAWYERRRSGLGAELLDAVSQSIEHITATPQAGTPESADRNTRRVLIPRVPYQLVYHLRPDEIVVVAVAHLKRRPGYWKSRL